MSRLPKFLPRTTIALLWIILVLYPNPLLLTRSIVHAVNPPVDPAAVQAWAKELPDDPALIEQQVLGLHVPYSVPWQTYGVPWYYPTTREVVAAGQGDCQARMLVLASILEAKGIPYRLEASIDHIWVEYSGKQSNELENQDLAVLQDGKLRLPERWDWRQSYQIEKDYFWDTMPLHRKLLLFGGLLLIMFWRREILGLGAIGSAVPRRGKLAPPWRGRVGKVATWLPLIPGPAPNSGSGERPDGSSSPPPTG